MMNFLTMTERVETYLAEKRRLGFELKSGGLMLHRFARYADESGHKGPLTTKLTTSWCKEQSPSPLTFSWAVRLKALRPFAKYMKQVEPTTEFPQAPVFGKADRRLSPHIYTEEEIIDLLAAASRLKPIDTLRPAMYEAFLGLIAATGIRVSEAMKLQYGDVDLVGHYLTIRKTKFKKSRYVPIHATVAEALKRYLTIRDRYVNHDAEQAFFLSNAGTPPSMPQIQWNFRYLRREVGLIPRSQYNAVRIHDFRHSFICRRVQRWQEEGADIDNAMAALATYVGHVRISHTYWYLSAVPDLMAVVGKRFEDFANEGPCHE